MIEIYTDGSCRANGYESSYGAFGFMAYKDNVLIKSFVQSEAKTTNNRMEQKAIIAALRWAADNAIDDIIIHTDSSLCYNAITNWIPRYWIRNGWLKSNKLPVLNRDLWEEIVELKKCFTKIKFSKVKGHTGKNDKNDAIDKLVQEASACKS